MASAKRINEARNACSSALSPLCLLPRNRPEEFTGQYHNALRPYSYLLARSSAFTAPFSTQLENRHAVRTSWTATSYRVTNATIYLGICSACLTSCLASLYSPWALIHSTENLLTSSCGRSSCLPSAYRHDPRAVLRHYL